MEIVINIVVGILAGVITAVVYSILVKRIAFKNTKLSIKLPGIEVSFDPEKPDEIGNIVNSYISDPQVFVAYAHKDKDKARELAEELKEHGLRVWFDEFNIKPGDSIRSKIDEGLSTSGYLVALLSKSSIESNWTQKEFKMALERENLGKWPKVIPVLIEETELPEYIKDKMYLDIREDLKGSIDKLIKTIKLGKNESVAKIQNG